jgi:hypothetical protein
MAPMAIDYGMPVPIFTRDGICTINNALISSETGLSSEKIAYRSWKKHEWG